MFRESFAGAARGRRARSALFWVGLLLLAGFSAGWIWRVGHRGLFMLDQSIVFDGAWRIVQGQVPYRDFVMPFGPVTFALQAAVFRLAGVDFSSMVLTAALLSLIGTLATVRLLWLLSSRSAALSLLGGLYTAVWFQAPFGTPWMEQTAFLFDGLALLAIVEGRVARPNRALFFAAGLASAAAILSKQNAGGLFVLVCAGCLWLTREGQRAGVRDLAAYAGGGACGAALFLAWLLSFSDLGTFVHYWFGVSSEIGLDRVAYWKLLGTIFFQLVIPSSVPLFIASSALGLLFLALARSRQDEPPLRRELILCAWLGVSLPQFENFFQLTTNNDAANNNAFVGVCVVAAIVLFSRLVRGDGRLNLDPERNDRRPPLELRLARSSLARISVVVGAVIAVYSLGEGLMIADARNVQEFAAGSSFDRKLDVAGASRVRWGEPTRITPQFCAGLGDMCKISAADSARDHELEHLSREDFESLVRTLTRRGENFFVFPDATILYGLTGRPSPQPLLYFHPGQSFSLADRDELDRAIVAGLERERVSVLVLERASFMGTHKLLSLFPRLNAWVERHFRTVEEFGNYRVLEASKPPSPEPVSALSRTR